MKILPIKNLLIKYSHNKVMKVQTKLLFKVNTQKLYQTMKLFNSFNINNILFIGR